MQLCKREITIHTASCAGPQVHIKTPFVYEVKNNHIIASALNMIRNNNIRPSSNKKSFPVHRPGLFFLPTRLTGNDFLLKGGLIASALNMFRNNNIIASALDMIRSVGIKDHDLII